MTIRWNKLPTTRFYIFSLLLFSASRLVAQGSVGTAAHIEPRAIVDMPTAGILGKGMYALDVSFYENGGLLAGFSAGLFGRLALGISYGGTGIIGSGDPVMNETPGFFVKVRVLDESVVAPAIALGFDNQGYDGYVKELSRYVIKSPGFYGVLSKNYDLLGYLTIHGGVNYSLERADGDRDVNFYVGAEKSLGSFAAVVGEYKLGLNDSDHEALGKGRGYLNLALNFSPGGGLTMGFALKDILKNSRERDSIARTIRIEFATTF